MSGPGNFDLALRTLFHADALPPGERQTLRARCDEVALLGVDFDDRAPAWPPIDEPRLEHPEDATWVEDDLADAANDRRARDIQGQS